MALVSPRTVDEAADIDRPALDAGVGAYGQVLNTWGAILNSPGLFAAYLPFLRQVNGPGALDQRVKELSAVRVAILNHCEYTTSHRITSALAQGIPEDDITAAATGSGAGLSERERAALDLAEQLTTEVPRVSRSVSRTGVSTVVRERAAELFDERELVELTFGISVWNALSRFHRVMDFELDMPDLPTAIAELL